jgi:hypothetical protein
VRAEHEVGSGGGKGECGDDGGCGASDCVHHGLLG